MRILHVVASFDPKLGGVSEAIRSFEIGLELINDPSILTRHIVCFDDYDEVQKWENYSLIVHALGKVSNPWLFNKRFSSWAVKHLGNYDVVIIHGIWLYHSYATKSNIVRLLKQGQKAPSVFVMPHGMLDPWFQKEKTRKLKSLRNWLYWTFFEKNIINSVDGILFTCEQERLQAQNTFKGYKPKNEYIVGLGISNPLQNSTIFKDISQEIVGNQKYLLFLGRIDYKKGVDLLIDAYFRVLLNGNFNIDTLPNLAIVGPGLDSSFGEKLLKAIANQPKILQEKVIFTGMLTGSQKWATFHNAEAFILPSHQENFGIAVVEALACRKIALISDKVNIWREIVNSNAGIVSEDSIDGTIQLLLKFFNLSDSQKESMEGNAYTLFEQKYTNVQAAMQLIRTINK